MVYRSIASEEHSRSLICALCASWRSSQDSCRLLTKNPVNCSYRYHGELAHSAFPFPFSLEGVNHSSLLDMGAYKHGQVTTASVVVIIKFISMN
jgi:hypothetical protein